MAGEYRELFTEVDLANNTAGPILNQDIANMGEVENGMKTRAIAERIVNPAQDLPILDFARNLDRCLAAAPGEAV
jgi:hypothetical protein